MQEQNKEIKRADNIIWNASSDYSLNSEIKAYDKNGKADLYLNYIIGSVHKYYNYSLLEEFFNYLKKDTNCKLLEELTWIALENCTYKKAKSERLVLENLRRDYSKKFLNRCNPDLSFNIIDQVKIAHFKRALGEKPNTTNLALTILNDLEFDEHMNTKQIISRMKEIIKVYFQYGPHFLAKNILPTSHRGKSIFQVKVKGSNSRRNSFFKRSKNELRRAFSWLKSVDQINKYDRKFMQGYYGVSILQEPRVKALEKILCIGNHKNCHVHFTRGNFDVHIKNNTSTVKHQDDILKQREKNNIHYNENFARNNNSISNLTDKIKNVMLVNRESSCRSEKGKLVAGDIWRSFYVHDNKIFIKNLKNDVRDLTVDIMLDASLSQKNRQEIIATEGYIIAESLTRCQIPVKVYSFCSFHDYTIINLFRDYDEVYKNNKIFNYTASGCNRDGLAVRAALYMMKNLSCNRKMLIVLSDGKPNDMQCIPASGINHIEYSYSDNMGVNDTALEVRKGLQEGISILGVFTGRNEDVAAAQKIYGRNLVHIKSAKRFADTVGVMLQNELNNIL
ncbi:MAG: hypothetical protein LKE46_10000 [Clostridium sp.]|jgi:hypothetical protein|nr:MULTISPECIES: hypothetical protein [Clostridium]MCH3964596.1 hypothetical protein [Clostridium sp.]MCH4198556.1 hypothetical protein [Clostridium tyrobutyricum]MCI1239743.1 hypothetical protein [Clostridium tyrobutyricum]MCI1870141.1 hypothetical protein [Clostridium sp.]MCI2039081.1 hypothetical protein [Clostridium luticellarii]